MHLTGTIIKVITCVTVRTSPSRYAAKFTDSIKPVTARVAVWSTFLWTISTIWAGRTCLCLNKMMCQCSFFLFYILVKLFLNVLYMQIHLPLSHLSPWNPASHPFGQDPFTWWHCSPRKQLLQLVLHSRPYLFPSHSIIN